MEVSQVLRMNQGDGEISYANNSSTQREAMFKSKPIIEDSVKKLYCSKLGDECFRIADLGCASGPNTLLLAKEIMQIFADESKELNKRAPMFQFFLNDLPGNDFNTIFKSLPSFYDKLKQEQGSDFGPCFIVGMPGSFYERLFPNNFLRFVHSTYSLHWRSQVPEGLVSETGMPVNKGNIFVAKTSPPCVLKAYMDLFKADFVKFLELRSQEMVPGGHIVLTMLGADRKASCSTYNGCAILELLGLSLHGMALEGQIEEAKLDCFNLPHYGPTPEEVRQAIEDEGSFQIQRLDVFEVDWDTNIDKRLSIDNLARGEYVARTLRVVFESLLVHHFGDAIIDEVFKRYPRKISEYLEVQNGQHTSIAISMTKVR